MEHAKKIICTVTNDLTYDQRMIRICSTLVVHGYDVLLVGRKLKKSLPLSQRPFGQKRFSCIFNKGFLFYAEYNLRLFLFLMNKDFDLINSIDLDTLLAGAIAAKRKDRKLVYDAHEYFTEVPEVVNRPIVKAFWAQIASVFIPKADGAYTVSKGLQDIFETKYKTKFSLVRNLPFAKIQTVEKNRSVDQKVILYQGAVNEGRGLREMILAMHELRDHKLHIIGEGDLSSQLRELVVYEKLEHRVSFLGYIKPEQLQAHTEAAWIGINLLENKGLSNFFSLANRTFDFIQAGLPAIHMNFPEYKVIQDKYMIGVLLDDLKTESIIAAINRFEHDSFYNDVKLNCMIASKELTWENEVGELLGVYEKVFDGKKQV